MNTILTIFCGRLNEIIYGTLSNTDHFSKHFEFDKFGRINRLTFKEDSTVIPENGQTEFSSEYYGRGSEADRDVEDYGRSTSSPKVDYFEYDKDGNAELSHEYLNTESYDVAVDNGESTITIDGLTRLNPGAYRFLVTFENGLASIPFNTLTLLNRNGAVTTVSSGSVTQPSPTTLSVEFQVVNFVEGGTFEFEYSSELADALGGVNFENLEISDLVEHQFEWDYQNRLTSTKFSRHYEQAGDANNFYRQVSETHFHYDVFGQLIATNQVETNFSADGPLDHLQSSRWVYYVPEDGQNAAIFEKAGHRTYDESEVIEGEVSTDGAEFTDDDLQSFHLENAFFNGPDGNVYAVDSAITANNQTVEWLFYDEQGKVSKTIENGGDLVEVNPNLAPDAANLPKHVSLTPGYQPISFSENGLFLRNGRVFDLAGSRFLSESPDAISRGLSNLYVSEGIAPSGLPTAYHSSQANYTETPKHSWSDAIHLGLDAAGLIPVAGVAFDAVNAGYYYAQGDYTNATLSGVAAIPLFGYAGTAAKLGLKSSSRAASLGGLAARTALKADIAANVALSGYNIQQGIANGNATQFGLGAFGIGINGAVVSRIQKNANAAPIRGGSSELGNALSGLGRNPLGRNLNTLDEFGSGAAFSGVFDPATGKFLAYPSGATRLANGGSPLNLVPRRGGHSLVNDVLSDLTGATRTNNLGFTTFLDDAGDISVDFFSRGVNGRNPAFSGNVVPQNMRQQILDAIRESTGRTVTGG